MDSSIQSIEGFFSQLFSELSTQDSVTILLFLLVSFLIGLLTGWFMMRGVATKQKRLIAEREHEIVKLQQQLDLQKGEKELREADFKRMEIEIRDFKSKIVEKDARINELSVNIETASTEVERLQSRVNADGQIIEDLSNQLIGVKTRMERMADELTGGEYTNDSTEMEKLKKENEELRASLQNWQNNGSNEDRLASFEEKLNLIQRGNQQLHLLHEKVSRLEKENVNLRAMAVKVQKLESENQAIRFMKDEIKGLRNTGEEYKQIEQHIRELERQNMVLRDEIRSLQHPKD